MDKQKRKPKKVIKRKKIRKFSAQVNCTCKKDCANLIDVVKQREIFDQFHGLEKWSEKTEFLRSIVKRAEVKENLNPHIGVKNKKKFS